MEHFFSYFSMDKDLVFDSVDSLPNSVFCYMVRMLWRVFSGAAFACGDRLYAGLDEPLF